MKMQYRAIALLTAGFAAMVLAQGCAYQAVAVSASVPKDQIRAQSLRNSHARVFIDIDDADLVMEARKPGISCDSHRYAVDVGPALRETIEDVVAASFASYEVVTTGIERGDAASDYSLIFELDEFDSAIDYSPMIWSATAHGRASLKLKVTAVGPDGSRIFEVPLSGAGSSDLQGSCAVGATALAQASTQAVGQLAERLVYQVINDARMPEAVQSAANNP